VAHGSEKRVRAPHFYAAAALALLTLAAYSNSFQAGFTLDSRQAVVNDQRVHEVSSQNLNLILNHTYWWPYDESGLYRPLSTLSYLFNYAVLGNGDRPFGYHAVNLLLHFTNVLLVYLILLRLTLQLWPSVFAAALWAVHPVLTESVTNIAGRADLLAGLGVLAGFYAYLRSNYIALALAAAVGIFSKESAIVLPVVILLYELTNTRRWRSAAIGFAAASFPMAAYLAQRANVLADALARTVPFTDNPLVAAGFWTGRLTALSVMGRYIRLLVWPASLSADYSWAQIPPTPDWVGLIIAAAAAGLILYYRRNRTALFVAAFAFVTLLPASNLLFPIGTIMAERFLYLPAVAFAVCLVVVLWKLNPRIAAAALGVAIAALGVRTWARNLDWRDDLTMARSLVRTSPNSFKAHRLLAQELYRSHAPMAEVLAESARSLAPLETLPDSQNSADTWRLAAGYYFAAGDYAKSASLLQRTLAIVNSDMEHAKGAVYPGTADVYRMLAESYRRMGKLDDAAVTLMQAQLATGDMAFRKALLDLYASGLDTQGCAVVSGPAGPALNPSCGIVHNHLCGALRAAGRTGEWQAYGCR
jgi:tetratricopeptide (TPR) repeat protein